MPRKRKFGCDFNDIKPKECVGSSKYFVIIPNGDVFACWAEVYYTTGFCEYDGQNVNKFHHGSLVKGTFKPLNDKMMCSLPCCEACDLEVADAKVVE